MASIECKECVKEFSEKEEKCPFCNSKYKVKSSPYIDQQLVQGEHLIYRCKIHWQIWIAPIFATILSLPFLIFSILLLISWIKGNSDIMTFAWFFFLPGIIVLLIWTQAIVNYLGTDLAITNRRVISKFGFIKRESFEINLDKIEGVGLKQGILGRIFGCASVIVKGTGTGLAPIPYIADYQVFKQKLLEECDKYKKNKE